MGGIYKIELKPNQYADVGIDKDGWLGCHRINCYGVCKDCYECMMLKYTGSVTDNYTIDEDGIIKLNKEE